LAESRSQRLTQLGALIDQCEQLLHTRTALPDEEEEEEAEKDGVGDVDSGIDELATRLGLM